MKEILGVTLDAIWGYLNNPGLVSQLIIIWGSVFYKEIFAGSVDVDHYLTPSWSLLSCPRLNQVINPH